jgi:shikimate kinase
MGAGKTTVAALLGEAWDLPVRDTDHDVEAAEGRSISDIFVDDGEEHFRALERGAVAAALAGHDGVLALGGGAVLDEGTRAALAGAPVVFLKVGLSDAVKRALLDERTPIYEAVARWTVDTDGRTPEDVAAEVAKLVEQDA